MAVVFRHGPRRWWHVSRWHLDTGDVEGAWLYGQLYARRGDVSPDGELLCYFVMKQRSLGAERVRLEAGSAGARPGASRQPTWADRPSTRRSGALNRPRVRQERGRSAEDGCASTLSRSRV